MKVSAWIRPLVTLLIKCLCPYLVKSHSENSSCRICWFFRLFWALNATSLLFVIIFLSIGPVKFKENPVRKRFCALILNVKSFCLVESFKLGVLEYQGVISCKNFGQGLGWTTSLHSEKWETAWQKNNLVYQVLKSKTSFPFFLYIKL